MTESDRETGRDREGERPSLNKAVSQRERREEG